MKAIIDGKKVNNLENYCVQSEVFDLTFPEDNVYDVRPGPTRTVCDGYWLFIKPLRIGNRYIYFKGENSLAELYTTKQLKNAEVFDQIRKHVHENLSFKREVLYELTIVTVTQN